MSFNPYRTKKTQEIFLSRKKSATNTHPPLFFNNSEINQKHLGLTLDSKFSFNEHIIIKF